MDFYRIDEEYIRFLQKYEKEKRGKYFDSGPRG